MSTSGSETNVGVFSAYLAGLDANLLAFFSVDFRKRDKRCCFLRLACWPGRILAESTLLHNIPPSLSLSLSLVSTRLHPMATAQSLKLLDVSHVSPPSGSVPETSLPLTFFDLFWIGLPPIQRLFFYELDTTTTTHFVNLQLPKIKHSLSISLQSFFSLAGHIRLSHSDGNHEIHYADGNSVSLTVAESEADFHKLIQNNPKGATEVRPFLPQLPSPSLLALQFTIFPGAGIVMGISLHHAAADGRSLAHFMKYWSCICRTGKDDNASIIQPPFYDRTALQEHNWLKTVILKQMADVELEYTAKGSNNHFLRPPIPELRATFVLSRSNVELLRRRVLDQVEESDKPFHCSTFVLTCSYAWICLIKSRDNTAIGDDGMDYFMFAADCRSRMDPPLSALYFGNCISICFAEARRSDLVSDRGLLSATKALRRGIQGLDEEGLMKGIESCIPRFVEQTARRVVSVAGSPQFRVYDIDFGWGRPKKTEVTSIDTTGAIYIGDSRNEEGGSGIEFGLSLPEHEMASFARLFQEGFQVGS
ncbi:hypothetical protein ACLOJK_013163 [Asimina triloba]